MGAKLQTSMDTLTARLEQKGGRAVKMVNDQMQAESKVIYQEIWNRIPVEHGNVEDALTIEHYRRKSWTIGIDESKPDDTGNYTVGDYAAWLNEDPTYQLGQASADKGPDVGPKFMERGLQAAIDGGSIDRCRDVLKQALES